MLLVRFRLADLATTRATDVLLNRVADETMLNRQWVW